MTTANSLQLSFVRETTAGTTPVTPRMRKARITGESLFYAPIFNQSDELRDDRMVGDPTQIMFESGGGVNFELSYPRDESFLSELLRSAMYAAWVNTAQRDNDGTADSIITDIGTVANTITFTTGTAFVVGQLVRTTGFTTAANNTVARVTTGGATSLVATAGGYVGEAAPPAAARVKVVGFQGASADITASATGLASTALDFTTLGLVVGQWIKIGGTATADKFATAVLNDWVRITAITATALTLDNRPAGWTTDAGTGKTLKVWFGDQIKNGATQTSLSIERGFLRQAAPTYIVNTGMSVNTFGMTLTNRQKVTGSAEFNGMGGSQGTVALDASPDAVTTNPVMSAHVNVGRLADSGTAVVAPNWAREFTWSINNNQRLIEDVSQSSPQGVLDGECTVSARVNMYFGSNTFLAGFFAGTPTAFNSRVQKDSQAVITQLPRVTRVGGGRPNATAKNTDVMLDLELSASKDEATSAHIIMDRLEYYE